MFNMRKALFLIIIMAMTTGRTAFAELFPDTSTLLDEKFTNTTGTEYKVPDGWTVTGSSGEYTPSVSFYGRIETGPDTVNRPASENVLALHSAENSGTYISAVKPVEITTAGLTTINYNVYYSNKNAGDGFVLKSGATEAVKICVTYSGSDGFFLAPVSAGNKIKNPDAGNWHKVSVVVNTSGEEIDGLASGNVRVSMMPIWTANGNNGAVSTFTGPIAGGAAAFDAIELRSGTWAKCDDIYYGDIIVTHRPVKPDISLNLTAAEEIYNKFPEGWAFTSTAENTAAINTQPVIKSDATGGTALRFYDNDGGAGKYLPSIKKSFPKTETGILTIQYRVSLTSNNSGDRFYLKSGDTQAIMLIEGYTGSANWVGTGTGDAKIYEIDGGAQALNNVNTGGNNFFLVDPLNTGANSNSTWAPMKKFESGWHEVTVTVNTSGEKSDGLGSGFYTVSINKSGDSNVSTVKGTIRGENITGFDAIEIQGAGNSVTSDIYYDFMNVTFTPLNGSPQSVLAETFAADNGTENYLNIKAELVNAYTGEEYDKNGGLIFAAYQGGQLKNIDVKQDFSVNAGETAIWEYRFKKPGENTLYKVFYWNMQKLIPINTKGTNFLSVTAL
jgi:hypothetical protein